MIKNIEISGFRLLNDFSADLGELTVVIGANATGKSSLIDCIQCISECSQFPLASPFSGRGGIMFLVNAFSKEARVGWKLAFNRDHPIEFYNEMPIREEDYVYEVELTADPYGQPVPIKEVLRTAQPRYGYKDCFKLLENRGGRLKVFDNKLHSLIDFDKAVPVSEEQAEATAEPQNNTVSAKKETSEKKRIMATEEQLLLSKMRFLNEYPEASAVRIMLSHFAFYPGFDVSRSSVLRTKPSEIKPITVLAQSGENLGAVLHEILTRYDYKTSAEEILDFFRSAYPHVELITPETAYSNPPGIMLRVREKGMNRPMELWDLSDGCLRFLCLAAALLNPIPPVFMALDEPEAGLHPRLLPIVADMIKTAAERTQVLVTTHSPDLLNGFGLEHIAVMKREDDHLRWNRPRDRPTLRKMLEQVLGDNIGDLHRSGELESMA